MIYLLYTIHVLVCLFLILVVLLQQGKGADLSVFGGGATQAAFGARGAVSLLHKLTVWGFVAFIVTTISIGFMTSSRKTSSVLSNVPTGEEAAPAAAEEPDALLEGEALETGALETGAPTEPQVGDPELATGEGDGTTSEDPEAGGEEGTGDGDGGEESG